MQFVAPVSIYQGQRSYQIYVQYQKQTRNSKTNSENDTRPIYRSGYQFTFCSVMLTSLSTVSNSMKQGPSSKASSSVSQEIPNIWGNPTAQYRLHMRLPLVPILSQTNSLHSLPSYYFKINFNIILQYMVNFSRGLFPSGIILRTLDLSHVLQFYIFHANNLLAIFIWTSPDINILQLSLSEDEMAFIWAVSGAGIA